MMRGRNRKERVASIGIIANRAICILLGAMNIIASTSNNRRRSWHGWCRLHSRLRRRSWLAGASRRRRRRRSRLLRGLRSISTAWWAWWRRPSRRRAEGPRPRDGARSRGRRRGRRGMQRRMHVDGRYVDHGRHGDGFLHRQVTRNTREIKW